MGNVGVVEYQMLAANEQAASLSLLSGDLQNTILLQLARVATGFGQAFSVYAVYREGQMTFEASAKLAVSRPCQSLGSILRELIEDADFLRSVLMPLKAQVNRHFARIATIELAPARQPSQETRQNNGYRQAEQSLEDRGR